MHDIVNIGILGAGKMAYWHLRAYRALPGVRIQAICNPRSERGRKLALKFRIPNVFRDPEELFRLPGLDGIDICVPTGLHKELICRAIQQGLHVYTEKPMCLNIEDADEIVEMNRRLGKIIFVGYNLRFCPEFLKVKEVLASGELGDVKYIWIQRGAWLNTDSYIFNPEWNAGIITELSSHALDLLRWWGFVEVKHVYAEGTNVFAQYPQPDTVCLNVKFQNGAMAVVTNSYGMPGISTEVCILGSRKMLRAKYGKCWVQSHPPYWSIPRLLRIAFREAVIYPYRILYNPFRGSCAHFVDCIRRTQPSLSNEIEGRETIRLASMLQESYSKGQVVAPRRKMEPFFSASMS